MITPQIVRAKFLDLLHGGDAHFAPPKKGATIKKYSVAACAFMVTLVLIGCTASRQVSRVEEHQSEDHKAIFNYLAESKRRYNQRKRIDLSRLTEKARINTQYHEKDAFLSPQKLQKVWPNRNEIIQSHEFRMQSIEVENISINGNTARVQTQRTLVSERWDTLHKYTFAKSSRNETAYGNSTEAGPSLKHVPSAISMYRANGTIHDSGYQLNSAPRFTLGKT